MKASSTFRRCCLSSLFLFTVAGLSLAAPSSPKLEREFLRPPASARPWVYWFWLNGNITSNGITADLEAMARVGIGGVLIMEVDQGTPKGEAPFGSDIWREHFKHVCGEAQRLGLEVNMNNDAGWCGSGAPFITPDIAMQKLVWSETNIEGPRQITLTLPQPTTVSDFFKDIAVFAFPTPAGDARISEIDGKAAFVPRHLPVTSAFPAVPNEQTISRDQIRVISSCLSSNGLFSWDVPAGKWTVLRLGHTPTGKDNHPAPEAGRGLESDKLSKAATEVMFKGLMGKLITDSKRLAGKTLVSTHIDSWETGSQNWTPLFREEFQKRRGYDPFLYLLTMTGRVIDSAEITERFLWDLRQTVSDLIVENYAGHFRRLAHQQGLRLSIEAYDGAPCDEMTYAGQADEPMAEFWACGHNTAYSCVGMSSAAHIYGRTILGAEAFTANDQEKWLFHPATIKTLGDWAFCEGINRFVFHRYALQPWNDRPPGMSMGPWGLHYERTQTWWEYSKAWHDYLARCQLLLRQGLFVADICFLQPEGSPRRFDPTMNWRSGNTPERPRYNFDGCTPEVVLTRMKVKNGKLVLPDGMSYELLVLPQVETMTPQLLRKVKDLVDDGATVMGPPPAKSPSLANYPQCDEEVKNLADQMWFSPSKSARKVVWGASCETPKKPVTSPHPLQPAKWIWHKEGNPAASAPVGERFFRRVFTLADSQKVSSAAILVTADNSFEVWVNGQSAGSGSNFKETCTFNIKGLLKPGANVIAIRAVNATADPNPAGLIGAVTAKFTAGPDLALYTDAQWESATSAPANWLTDAGANSAWGAALEMGALPMQPWGELDKSSDPLYAFPAFPAVADLLKGRGIPPDFQADASLRFIHRRDSRRDIYFVANSSANWLRANCRFRIAGREAQIWNPETGQISTIANWEEKDGITTVPLEFEPAGSLFVIFGEKLRKSPVLPITQVMQNGNSLLPGSTQSLIGRSPLALNAKSDGALELLAFEPGTYQLRSGSGKEISWNVSSLATALELAGPWTVNFQTNRGAPECVTFDRLTDWAQHSDPGVKHFSGTAVYSRTFDFPAAALANAGLRHYLDLGSVAVMAQVTLNGKDLGVLWKPPYRLDVTAALRAGENRLEIKVVNLWVNRMIGDEQLPEDSDRKPDGTLKAWPQWLQQEKSSPGGRHTFTSWRLWKKDSPLQPSGLLGPVKIVPAAIKTSASL